MNKGYEQQIYEECIDELSKMFHMKQMLRMNEKIALALDLREFDRSREEEKKKALVDARRTQISQCRGSDLN